MTLQNLREEWSDYLATDSGSKDTATWWIDRFQAHLESIADEVEEIIVDTEGLSKFPLGSIDLHTTIGGNAGTRRAADMIRNSLKI